MDEELFKNLLFLKTFDGDVSDLCLDFTITEEHLGQTRTVPLLPGKPLVRFVLS